METTPFQHQSTNIMESNSQLQTPETPNSNNTQPSNGFRLEELNTPTNEEPTVPQIISPKKIGPKILNLSRHKLTLQQISLLSKGPKFCISTKGRPSDFSGDSYNFGRRLSIHERFYNNTWNDESLIRTPSKKFISSSNKELQNIISTINKLEPSKKDETQNIPQEEHAALMEIKELVTTTLEIKKADKTNTFVIMDKDKYKEQLVLQCHLNTSSYEEVNVNSDHTVYTEMTKLLNKFDHCTTKNEKKAILRDDWRTSRFYILPKINKSTTVLETINNTPDRYIEMPMPDNLTSRPIVSGPNAVTKGLSQLLEKILTPITFQLRTFIKNEYDFLGKFPRNIGTDTYIMCCDIKSLYTSIPNDLGMTALQYWIQQKKSLIPSRFSERFILEAAKFVLENNFFMFNEKMWRQKVGTAMGKEMAGPYACLTVGYLEETILFPRLLPAHFPMSTVERIVNNFYRFVDDGITAPPDIIQPNNFLNILNSMNPSIQYTMTIQTPTTVRGEDFKKINFLSIKILSSEDGEIKTDIFYKDTNSHDYLNYNSHHPTHVKNNIAYCLAKAIIVFTTDSRTMEDNLNDLKTWLIDCGHPRWIVEKGIHNARLQGPANAPSKKPTIPFVSTFYSNLDNKNVLDTTKDLLQKSTNQHLREVFGDVQFINAYRQPPNLLRQITSAEFITSSNNQKKGGIYLCKNTRCKICKLYLQECNSFKTSKGVTWDIKSHITCHSKNVVYFQICNMCTTVSNIGKTDNLRERTNNHISCCRKGTGSDVFDMHVYECSRKMGKEPVEPFFKLYVFMELTDYQKLRNHEKKLQLQGHDTINRHS